MRQLDARSFDALFRPGRVHRRVYTDPALFRLEMAKIFAGSWVYLGHETEIPAANDFVTRRLGLRSVILCRDQAGAVRVLLNRCMHRGATVCREDSGNAKFFTCGYHCWTYENSGKIAGIPLEGAYGDFDRRDFDLRQPPRVDIYRGFIFATLNEDVPPLHEHLAGAKEPLDYWIDRCGPNGPTVGRGAHRMVARANWKCLYDNAGDGYHPGYSHESMIVATAKRYGGNRDIAYFLGNPDETNMTVASLGRGHTMLDQRPEMHAESAWERQRPQPGREAAWQDLRRRMGDERARRVLDASMGGGINLNIFPNLMIIGNQIQVIEPLAVDRTQTTWYPTLIADADAAVNAIRMRTQEDFPILGEVDDLANVEACMEGMEIEEIEWIDIGRHLDKDGPGSDGREVGLTTSDLHMRVYFAEWRRLMEQPVTLTTAGAVS